MNNTNTSGIYAIRNGDRVYIGSAVNIHKRWYDHCWRLRRGDHDNIYLQRAWNKHGGDAFEFIILEECSVELLIEREQYHMDLADVKYNINPIAGSCLGRTHTDETKAKIGNANRGRTPTDEARSKMSEAHRGRKQSPEAVAKRSASNTGRKRTAESREKMRQAALGRSHTPETREKLSAATSAQWARKRAEEASDA